MKIKQITLVAALLSTSTHASMSDQMDDAFGSMVNTTTPKAYSTAKRGVISGGQVFVRNDIKHVSLASATAPSFSAGCGGIDLYGGSFSFINADQFLETFQAIGANALGYGVKLALQSACPSCEEVMTSLEKTAQFINSMNVDSCQAAQGIVNAGVDFATTAQSENKSQTMETLRGGFSDISEAMTSATTNGKSAANTVKENNPSEYEEKITGNIAWRSFKMNNVEAVFGADEVFLEMLMAITGTVVISNPEATSDPESTPSLTRYDGHKISLAQLVNGTPTGAAAFKYYKCTDGHGKNNCLTINDEGNTFSDEGMKARLDTALSGTGGLLDSLATDSEWTDEAKKILGVTSGIGQICTKTIFSAMTTGEDGYGTAYQVAQLCSSRMALETSYSMIVSQILAIRKVILNSEKETANVEAKEMMLTILDDSLRSYNREYEVLSANLPVEGIILQLQALDFVNGKLSTVVKGY